MCETERETAPPPGKMIALLDRRCRVAYLPGGTGAGTSTITVTYDDGVRAGDLLTLPELQHLRARSARRGRAPGLALVSTG